MLYRWQQQKMGGLRRLGLSLLLILCGTFLLVPVTSSLAGGPIDVCTLVTTADVEAVFGGPVIYVRNSYRSLEAIKHLRTFLGEEELRQYVQKTGIDLSFLVEETRCEYDDLPDAIAADLGAYPAHRLVISLGRARNKAMAAKAFTRVCSGKDHPPRASQPLSGIGDRACSIDSSAVIVLKNEVILSLTLLISKAGSRGTVDLKSLAVKAVSRLP
ncbi:MAG: hypothetical protein AB7G75_07680 [Candidatus Binatia bacterium]